MGINIKEMIAKILINDNPVLKDKMHILLISNEYLQIFNLLYLIFSSFSYIEISIFVNIYLYPLFILEYFCISTRSQLCISSI